MSDEGVKELLERLSSARVDSAWSEFLARYSPLIMHVIRRHDAGDVVVQQRVTGTAWRLPAQLNLQPGAEYFVRIDAYPSGDKAVSSDHVPFRVSD